MRKSINSYFAAATVALFVMNRGLAQCPTASFDSNTTFCLSENVNLTNNSTSATSYDWDLCSGELFEAHSSETAVTISGISDIRDLELVEDNGNWYGFVVDRTGNNLHRLEFGSTLKNTPDTYNLGNIDSELDGSSTIVVVQDAGNWYGLIHNGGAENVVRIDFGTSIDNDTPTATEIATGLGGVVSNLDLRNDDGDWVAVLSNYFSEDFNIINIGSSMENIPGGGDILTSSSVNGAGFINVTLYYECDTWYGLAAGYDDKSLYRLEFGTALFSSPTITNIGNSIFAQSPFSLDFTKEHGDYVCFVNTIQGLFYRVNLGDDIENVSLTTENLATIGTAIMGGVNLTYESGEWSVYQVRSTGIVYRITFPLDCDGSSSHSTVQEPTNVVYNTAGTYGITLRAMNDDGVVGIDYKEVTVTANTAPAISFDPGSNECLGQANDFTPSDLGLVSYQWSFDGGTTTGSTATSPSHTFSQTGDSTVILTVSDGTCTNTAKDVVSIFPVPVTPTFFDSGSPYCTGADINFTNLFDESNYNGATLSYTWDYNGEDASSDRDGTYNFDSEGTKTITLTASIPGCSTTSADSDLDVIAGPSVSFSYGDKCLGDETDFTNTSTGSGITGQTWDFGDSNGSTALNPSHTYEAAGDYNVSLTVDNDQGCSNTLIVPLTVDAVPVANFNMGVGCEGQVVGFEDASTVTSANIESYDWDFDGLGSSTQEDPTFTFDTQGNYTVQLTVESTYGCTDVVSKNLNVQLAPVAAFSIDLGCLDETTRFIDETETEVENPINIWYWDINGDIVPNTQNPSDIFDTPGDYTATLTVTPSNLCTSTVSQEFTVYELPEAGFTYHDACDNQFTAFSDASTSATNLVAYNWQFDDQGNGNSNPSLFMFDGPGTYQVGYTVIDEIGCESSMVEDITINPSPVSGFTVSSDIGPAPLTIDFTNTSEDASSYLWQFNDTAETTSTDNSPQFSYTELGDYDASLIAYNDLGCSDTLVVPITVADPILDLELIQISSEESDEQTSLTLTVRNSGNIPIRGFKIRIDLENNSSVFETYTGVIKRNETISYPLNFTFSTLSNNTDYICINLIDMESEYQDIDDVNNEKCFDFSQEVVVENAYPNPAANNASTVRLNMILPTEAPIQIFLMDAAGNILYQEVYQNTSTGLNSFFLDIYSYQQGLYFIKVVYNNIESTQRFMKL